MERFVALFEQDLQKRLLDTGGTSAIFAPPIRIIVRHTLDNFRCEPVDFLEHMLLGRCAANDANFSHIESPFELVLCRFCRLF